MNERVIGSRAGILAGALMAVVVLSMPLTDAAAAAHDPAGAPPTAPTASDCPASGDALSASYRIVRERADGMPDVSRYRFVRDARRVMHVYPDRGIAEFFALTPNGRMRSVRYFDEPRRAVTFEPIDLALGGERRGWANVSTPFDERLRATLEPAGSSGEGCERSTILRGADDDPGETELHWMEALALPAFARSESGGGATTWELESWSADPARVTRAFNARKGYREIDFADIGDSEADPFIMRMIKLGFIPHGASGFYDSDERPVSDGGQAHARGKRHLH